MNSIIKNIFFVCLWLLMAVATSIPAWAHDPFDGNIQLTVFDNKIEAKVTLGYDATRAFLQAGHLPPRDTATMTRPSRDGQLIELPLALAPKLMTLHNGPASVDATAFMLMPNDVEINFLIIYPRPAAEKLLVNAAYFDLIEYMRPGMLVVVDQHRKLVASVLLSKSVPGASVPLVLPEKAAQVGDSRIGFAGFFKLGVEHILTGFDHLLFLCALLITMRRIGPMLGIISAFTLAHSVTLALAALDVATVRPAIVEPLIAASIIVVCLENFVRREATADRYWMAGAFGLIHGFGFAGILRETALAQPGAGIVVPLLSFNLGVETGQLLVAALAIPLLLLVRRKPFFLRYGSPAVSAMVILISGYWLIERI